MAATLLIRFRMKTKRYGVVVPTPNTSMHAWVAHYESGTTSAWMSDAWSTSDIEEARGVADRMNMRLRRPVGSTSHPSCYVAEVL